MTGGRTIVADVATASPRPDPDPGTDVSGRDDPGTGRGRAAGRPARPRGGVAAQVAVTGLVAAVLLGLALILAPPGVPAGVRLAGPDAWRIYPAGEAFLPRTPAPGEPETTLARTDRDPAGGAGQLHWRIRPGTAPAVSAILVPVAGRPVHLFVNGAPVASVSPAALPGPLQGGYSLAAAIPRDLLVAGDTRIDLLTGRPVWSAGLPLVLAGDRQAIAALTVRWAGWRSGAQIVALLAGLCGLAAGLVGLVLGRFRLPILGGATAAGVLLAQVWAGQAGPGAEGAARAVAVLCGPALLLAGGLAAAGAGSVAGWRAGPLLGLGAATAAAGALTVAAMAGWWPGLMLHPAAGPAISLAVLAPASLAGIGLPALVIASAFSLLRERRADRELASRQRLQLAEQARLLQQQVQLRAVLEERQRFTRDIHDGIGGHLLSLLWRVRMGRVEPGEIASEIEQGLADLRMVADALQDEPDSLADALENFAARARQQLDAAGIAFDWRPAPDLTLRWDDQRRVLTLYRILQEAVANVVRHSRAAQLAIRCSAVRDGSLLVVVEDDGVGIDPAARPGRGLANMRSRAASLGGRLETGPGAGGRGTRIAISLPPAVTTSASAVTPLPPEPAPGPTGPASRAGPTAAPGARAPSRPAPGRPSPPPA